jgi:hypothetical protein
LEAALRAVEPSAFLVAPRILRRVIRTDRQITGATVETPHRKSYVIDREPLLAMVDRSELGLAWGDDLPSSVILLERPRSGFLNAPTRDDALTCLWRILFHAKIDQSLGLSFAAGELTPDIVRRRIEQLGPALFDEIRDILGEERFLLPPRDESTAYIEFAAVFFELLWFSPSTLPYFFPSIESTRRIERILQQDVDAQQIFAATRPVGAPEPVDAPELRELDELAVPPDDAEAQEADSAVPEGEPRSESAYRKLCERAERASVVGNAVRAAILSSRADRVATRRQAARAKATLKAEQDRLSRRLADALGLPRDTAFPWQESIAVLVRRAADGVWTSEGRLLYDLQKVCVDHERQLATIDLGGWLLSFGRRPLKRPLPNHGDILMSKHLHTAARRLNAVRLSFALRHHLAELIRGGMETTDARIRECFRPKIVAVFDRQGFVPHNLPERVARKKLVEELLDRVVVHGHLTLGDLRDAISRNNLKFPDLLDENHLFANNVAARIGRWAHRQTARAVDRGGWLLAWLVPVLALAAQWGHAVNRAVCVPMATAYGGSPLLRVDRQMAVALDGAYRGGEVYLRIMQRLVALGFGTRIGRFLTRFFLVPFGGAFVILKGLRHVSEMIGWKDVEFDNPLAIASLGLLLLELVNFDACRRVAGRIAGHVGHALRLLCVDWPLAVLQIPCVRWILDSRWFSLVIRFGFKPLAISGLLWIVFPHGSASPQVLAFNGGLLFVFVNVLLNSRVGRTVEEMLVDGAIQAWHQIGLRVLTGLFSLVMEFFKQLVETVERLLYSVDEWLRFKSGEGPWTVGFKAVFKGAWSCVTYVVRFCVNLLIEPQINPIKHFPVVTVSHKMLFPLIPTLGRWIEQTMGVETAEGMAMATLVIWSIPGIFGFLVWELKENWRLFAANRRLVLHPVGIGDHGETMIRLLRRGFHSGTLPKRFAKLRRAERKARRTGNWNAVRKHLQVLQHLATALQRYVEREFIELLRETGAWPGDCRASTRVQLGSRGARFVLQLPSEAGLPLIVVYHARAGWLVAGACRAEDAEEETPQGESQPDDAAAQDDLLAVATLGLHCTAGASFLYQQVESALPASLAFYRIEPDGIYGYSEAFEQPIAVFSPSSDDFFQMATIAWTDWVAYWESAGRKRLPGHAAELSALVLAQCKETSRG